MCGTEKSAVNIRIFIKKIEFPVEFFGESNIFRIFRFNLTFLGF